VLYDEPTTMVDPLMARRLGNLIGNLKLHLKLTSVVVTHDMYLVEKLADHVVFLDRGKVIFYGTLAEMERSSEGIVRQFLELDLIDVRAGLKHNQGVQSSVAMISRRTNLSACTPLAELESLDLRFYFCCPPKDLFELSDLVRTIVRIRVVEKRRRLQMPRVGHEIRTIYAE
jgi:ABC-type multidrug transport system ATPase subunit